MSAKVLSQNQRGRRGLRSAPVLPLHLKTLVRKVSSQSRQRPWTGCLSAPQKRTGSDAENKFPPQAAGWQKFDVCEILRMAS